jgi:mono/diheme cytochrome c family protein
MRITAYALAALLVSGAGAADAADLARGEYLVKHVAACGNCHSPLGPGGAPVEGQELSGRFVIEVPEFKAIAPNITPAARVGDWSDEEFARAVREGIRPDGTVILPLMPFELYRDLSDRDLTDMVAYVRSVPAVENDPGASVINIPLPPAYGPPVESVAEVPEGETVEYGEYLAGPVAHCVECHTPMIEGGVIDFEHQLGAGGRVFDGPWGVSMSLNLTPNPDGLARWTDDEVISMVRTGHRPDGSPMMGPMGYAFYAGMSDRDAHAIVKYLRTLPVKETP